MDATPADVEAARDARESANRSDIAAIKSMIQGNGVEEPGLVGHVRDIKRDTNDLKERMGAVEKSCAAISLLPCGQHQNAITSNTCRIEKFERAPARILWIAGTGVIMSAVAAVWAVLSRGR